MKIKGVILFILAAAFLSNTLFAQQEPVVRWSFAPQVGTDIGVTLPYPISKIEGSFNPYPDILPSLGARTTFRFRDGWTFAAEVTYKTVAMTADARVENQKMRGGADGSDQYFTGTAFMESSFTQLEVPLYLKYMFGKSRSHRVLIGGYYSYILDAKFVSEARKGFIGAAPDNADDLITPDNPRRMDFSGDLSGWDIGVLVGYELGINSKLNMGIRVMTGVKDIFRNESPFENSMIHLRGTLVVSYNIFETGNR
ncbi:MAG: PorT family protein [Bacteroidetes bacterium HGW-Bacteroidetes-10]|nr:MAG: PorT family protein [Bacteroidetes bacterium HGW-Bacteroidetes-10]